MFLFSKLHLSTTPCFPILSTEDSCLKLISTLNELRIPARVKVDLKTFAILKSFWLDSRNNSIVV